MAGPRAAGIKIIGLYSLPAVRPTNNDETKKDVTSNPINIYIGTYSRLILVLRSMKAKIPSNAFTLFSTVISQRKEINDRVMHSE